MRNETESLDQGQRDGKHELVERVARNARLALYQLVVIMVAGCLSPEEAPEVDGLLPDDHEVGVNAQALTTLSPFPLGIYPIEIRNVSTGKCIQGGIPPETGGGPATQATCDAGNDQTWFLIHSGGGLYQVRVSHVGGNNLYSGTAVGITDATASGAEMFGFTLQTDGSYRISAGNVNVCLRGTSTSLIDTTICGSSTNQRWLLLPRVHSMHLIARHSTSCLDVPGGSTASDVALQQFDCADGSSKQQWDYAGISGTTYVNLVSLKSGKCIDVRGSSTLNDAVIVQNTCVAGDDSQQWLVTENGFGTVIRNRRSGRCMEVAGAATGDGATVQQRTCNGGDHQRWFWANYFRERIQVVQVATSAGTGRKTVSHDAVQDNKAKSNDVFQQWGVRLTYSNDRVNLDNNGVYNVQANPDGIYTCPDGTTAKAWICAQRYAMNWPDRVVVYVTLPGPDFAGSSSGEAAYVAVNRLETTEDLVCSPNSVPNTQFLAHEFGHYMGLNHTFGVTEGSIDDGLSDTLPDPDGGANTCLAPLTPTGIFPGNGQTVATDNALSYFYNIDPKITPMQASITRAAAYVRLYN